jgi:hypothetical protein
MQKARRMLGNLSVINDILALALALFLSLAVFPMFSKTVRIRVPVPKKQPAAAAAAQKQEEAKTPSPADYVVIAEQNLFHPERKIPVDKKDAAAPLPKPEFVLYGTLLTDELHLAYMEDKKAPQNSPSRGKKQIPVKLGESLSGFTLKEIDTDKVVMIRGEEKIDVYLNDTTKSRETAGGMPLAQQAAPPGARPPFPANGAAATRQPVATVPAPAAPAPAASSAPASSTSSQPRRGGFGFFRRPSR